MNNKSLLLVEDNEIAIKVSLYILQKHGFVVDVKKTAKEALSALASKKYEIILLDLGLPDADGYQVAKKIRTLPGFAKIKIIALTAHSQDDPKIRQECLNAGINEIWSKPLTEAHCLKI